MEKILKKLGFLPLLLCAILACTALTSCGGDDEPGGTIVGKWSNGSYIMTLGKGGSYKLESEYGLYRTGSYSYNSKKSLLVLNVKNVDTGDKFNFTYIVQTLNSTTLVLLYTDGDVQGYYTRVK